MKSILLVCLGNICRSSMAEGAMRLALDEAGLGHVTTDSAGTSGWHAGGPPDPRAVKAALMRNMDISGQRARQIEAADFDRFDIVAAMDRDNYARLRELQPDGTQGRVHLFLEFAGELPVREVPDPYYGNEAGFEHALDLIELAARGLVARIAARAGPGS
ncbi:MAG: low molecular weight protein-tyrosine-phosphatase [Pseudomonadota bacterium]